MLAKAILLVGSSMLVLLHGADEERGLGYGDQWFMDIEVCLWLGMLGSKPQGTDRQGKASTQWDTSSN